MPDKSIALLIPVHNGQETLEKSILSIRGEDKDIVDIIVVDDGSAEPVTLDRLRDYNITLLRLPENQGIQHSLNAGLKYILQKDYLYTARLDAGDAIIAGRFLKQKNFLDSHPDHAIVGSWARMVTSSGDLQFIWQPPVSDAGIQNKMHMSTCFCHPAVMMRNSAVRQTTLYSSHYSVAQDYDFFFRLLKVGKGANLPEPLVSYEVMNPAALSYKKRRRQLTNRLKIQGTYFDFKNIYSYAGVAKTLVSLILPYSLIHVLKTIVRRP